MKRWNVNDTGEGTFTSDDGTWCEWKDVKELKKAIYDSFIEGYYSYETACVSFTEVELAWKHSEAKDIYDSLGE